MIVYLIPVHFRIFLTEDQLIEKIKFYALNKFPLPPCYDMFIYENNNKYSVNMLICNENLSFISKKYQNIYDKFVKLKLIE